MKINKSKLSDFISFCWESLKTDTIILSIFCLLIALAGFFGSFLFTKFSNNDFWNGINIELFGIVFDVLILVLLFNWINQKGERKRRISSLHNEIDDFRHWKSEQAKFLIRGRIKRLNTEGVSAINLKYIDISNPLNELFQFSKINLNGSGFLQSNLSNLNMSESYLEKITDHYSDFSNSNFYKCNFKNSHFQGTNFKNSYFFSANFDNTVITSSCDFSKSDIRNISFSNAKIESAKFDNAIVNENFMEQVIEWNLNGRNIFENYEVVKKPERNKKFSFYLKKTLAI
jgi:uncharacterized protein YjbI with pentapeptide repeats